MNWKNKKVLVTGSEGLIGKELCLKLEELGAILFKFDIKRFWTDFDMYEQAPMDITNYDLIKSVMSAFKPDYIFHLFGVKGSPKMTKEKPLDFMIPMLQGDTNMIRAAKEFNVKAFLYTSSIAVLNPETDKYPAWAKKTSETLIEAYRVQSPLATQFVIVRPANVYGRFDNFNNPNAMVVTSLVHKAMNSPNLHVWGDGTQERDFINAKDVARGMMLAMEKMPKEPINLCSGFGVSIKSVVEVIQRHIGKALGVVYEKDKYTGDKRRVMPSNGNLIGFEPEIDLEDGIKEVIEYAQAGNNNPSN